MKALVAFYSRTGNTKSVGEEIARCLNADVDEIVDKKNRAGIIGFLGGAIDALFDKSTEVEYMSNPQEYDLVIIGSPVWAGRVTPAVKAYLSRNRFNKTGFFCTYSSKAGKSFERMEELSRKPVGTLGVRDKHIEKSNEKIREFCELLMV